MSKKLVSLQTATRETKEPYYRIWRLVVSDQVTAVRARRKGTRRIVWLVDLAKLKQVLANLKERPQYEILEETVPH